MSVTDTVLRRLLGVPDEDRARSEILLALDGAGWLTGYQIMCAVKKQTNGEIRQGPGGLHRTLGKLEDERLLQRRTTEDGLSATESRTFFKLTDYGQDELEQMGAENV